MYHDLLKNIILVSMISHIISVRSENDVLCFCQ